MAFSKCFRSSKEICDWPWSEKTSIECRSIVRNPLTVLEHVVGLFLWLSCQSCVFAVCVNMIFFMLTCDVKGCVGVFLCSIRGFQRRGTGWVKQSSGGVKKNNAGAPGPCVQGHLAWDAPALCNLHLCGVTSKSRCFWERLGQMAIISFLSSASIWCLSIPPRNIQWGRAPTCMKTKYERRHKNVNTEANRKRCDISSILKNGCDQITHIPASLQAAAASMDTEKTPNLLKFWRSWCRVLYGSRPWAWSWSGPCCRQPQGGPCGAVSARGSTRSERWANCEVNGVPWNLQVTWVGEEEEGGGAGRDWGLGWRTVEELCMYS